MNRASLRAAQMAPTADQRRAARRATLVAAFLAGMSLNVPAGAQSGDEGWATYRHPTGAYIEHPQDWRLQATQMGIALVPPDFDPNAELIVALGESAAGLSGPSDPQVGQYFDVLMSQVAPAMRRSAATSAVPYRDGAGVQYDYAGVLNTGQPARAQFRTAILSGQAVAIALVATNEVAAVREPVVRRIFASLGYAEPQRDPALVGAWQATRTESSHSSSGSVFFRTDSVHTLSADGRVMSRSRTHGNVTGAAGGTAARESETQTSGTWSAADGRFFIFWDDGTTTSGSYDASGAGVSLRIDGADGVVSLQSA